MIPIQGSFLSLRAPINDITTTVKAEIKEKEWMGIIKAEILFSKRDGKLYNFKDGLICCKGKLWIPTYSKKINMIMEA